MQAKIEKGYHQIKEWDDTSFGRLLPHHTAYFMAELKRTGIPSIATAVEIGFGAGSFLTFCAKKNIKCLGVELDSHQVDLARRIGFDVITAAEFDAKVAGMPQVDLIVLFDVLEHIPKEQLVQALLRYGAMLKPGGCMLVRVPNGDSPFGLFNQHGDITHCMTIGSQMVPQLAILADMDLVFVGGEAWPVFCGSLKWMLHRMLQWPVRQLLDLAIRWCFYPKSKASFSSPNLTFILRRKVVADLKEMSKR
jgi:SAM-dependent methyltransferase